MEWIREIDSTDFGKERKTDSDKKYTLRKAPRAIVINNSKIALLFVSKHNYHKLPGGGVEPGEDLETALHREILEETGCNIKIKQDIGMIIEYRDDKDMRQESYCYLAEVDGKIKEPSFTDEEKADGFKLIWVTIDNAI
ncbi:MAG: NUDIX domain-containing protein, partial [Candidatus Aenigmarchaeota archaeon]|nr:NUDIX domain-containing protein [Candidatus Aenigmarchaeota archaeon]